MPVLLLTQGDQAAKELLRSAIANRYGLKPPPLETIRLDFRGRANTQIGPVQTWLPVDATALFRFPNAMRWDFTIRPPRHDSQRQIESFDGTSFYRASSNKATRPLTDLSQTHSITQRLWALAATLLTPLNDINVNLTNNGHRRFKASQHILNDATTLILNDDGVLKRVQSRCFNPDTNRVQLYTIDVSEELVDIDSLLMPERLRFYWDKKPAFELFPYAAATDLVIPDSIFRAAYEGNTIRNAQA